MFVVRYFDESSPCFRRRTPLPTINVAGGPTSNRVNFQLACAYIRRDSPLIRTTSFSSIRGKSSTPLGFAPTVASDGSGGRARNRAGRGSPAEAGDDGGLTDGALGWVTSARLGGGPSFAREVAAER